MARQLPLPEMSHPWRRRGAADARPFVKWAGGKTQLLGELAQRLPQDADPTAGTYYEPFVGGGALFFTLQPRRAVLSDVNHDLVQLYLAVRDDVEGLIETLGRYRYDKDCYYETRAIDPATLCATGRAARMLYLNRTCFNGLYRVNRRGRFNVPIGRYKNPTICDEDGLRSASRALADRRIEKIGFADAVRDASPGDFVYFDPPYNPVSETANFTAYTPWPFGDAEQRALADVFAGLADRGVYAMTTNSDTPLIKKLYKGFRIERVLARRNISRRGSGRGPVGELIITTY